MSETILRYPDFDPSINYHCRYYPNNDPPAECQHTVTADRQWNLLSPQQKYNEYQHYQTRLLEAYPVCYCVSVSPSRCQSSRLCDTCDMNNIGLCDPSQVLTGPMGWT